MKLLYYPNVSLTTKCEPIVEFNEELHALLDQMKQVMLEHKGVGLSANQVGVHKQVMLMQDNKNNVHELINPVIVDTQGMVSMSEGCLSAPNVYIPVARPEAVLIQYQDRTGEVKKVMAEGLEARVILHEMDHLQGEFYFNRVNRQTRKAAIAKLKKVLK
jgi:peptide deformylase